MIEPRFNPMFYVMRNKYGTYTRLVALRDAHDANVVSDDEFLHFCDYILNVDKSVK